MAFSVQGSFQLVMGNYRGYSQASEVEGDGNPEGFPVLTEGTGQYL